MSRERGPQFNSDGQPEKKKRGRPSKAELEQRALQEREQIAKGLENEVFDFGTPEKQETKDATVEESKTEAEFSPQPEMPESAEKMVFVEPESVGPTEVEPIEKQPEQEGEPDNQEPSPEEPPSPENPEDNQDIKDIQEGINEILQKSIRGEGAPDDIEALKDYFAKTKESLEKKISNLNDEIGELRGDDEDEEGEESGDKEEENADEIEEKENELEKIQKTLEELNNRKEAFDRALQTGEAPEIELEEEPEDDNELAKQARAMDKVRREYIDLMKLKTQMMAENPELDFSKDLIGRSLEAKADDAERVGDLEEYQRAIKEMGEHYKKMDADGMELPPLPPEEVGANPELNEGTKRDIREIFQYDFQNLELERNKLKESGEGTVDINGKTYDDAEFWREKDKLFKLDEALTKDRWDEETKVSIMEALNSKSEQVAREMLEEEISSPEVLEKGKDFDKLLSLRKEIYKNLTGEDLDKTPESIANEKMFAINKESWEIRKQEAKNESQIENQVEAQETENKEEQIQEAKDEIAKAFQQEEISETKEVWEAQEKKIAGEEKQKERGGIFMAYGGLALYGALRGVAFIFDRMLNLADIADNPSGWIKKRIADWSDRQQKKFGKHVETYFPEAFARKKLDKEG